MTIRRPAAASAVALTLAAAFLAAAPLLRAEETSETKALLKQALERYPDADANHDGVLTMSEARAYQKKLGADGAAAVKAPKGRKGTEGKGPQPTFADVHYGPYDGNVLDFWKADGEGPRPVVVFIHGGGFVGGDKSQARGTAIQQRCLAAGVSYAAINYRFRTVAPIQDVLRDCARAIQFIRSKSTEWNVNKPRIATHGGSAGAGTSLWLAFHDDLADPANADPVLRESSRIVAAGAASTQATYDILRWEEVLGKEWLQYAKEDNPATFYGLKDDSELRSEAGQKVRADCDMLGLISKGDAPVYLSSSRPGGAITDRGHALHHPLHAMAVKKRCDEVGVEAVLNVPGVTGQKESADSMVQFLLDHLGANAAP